MIAVYVALALAFWTPRNHDVPPCGGLPGVQIEWVADGTVGSPMHRAGFATLGSCRISIVTPEWNRVRALYANTSHPTTWVRRIHCAVIVHELGHAGMSLEHSSNPHSIMNGDHLNIPKICKVL